MKCNRAIWKKNLDHHLAWCKKHKVPFAVESIDLDWWKAERKVGFDPDIDFPVIKFPDDIPPEYYKTREYFIPVKTRSDLVKSIGFVVLDELKVNHYYAITESDSTGVFLGEYVKE